MIGLNRASAQRVRGRLLLTLSLGEAPDDLPSEVQRRRGIAAAAAGIDGGPIDRLLRHFGAAARVTRLHEARRGRFDTAEHLSGVARVLRVEVAEDQRLHHLVDALRQLPIVERASADYLAAAPFETTHGVADADADWQPRALIRLPEALGYEPGDAGVAIGLADTGVTLGQGEIARQLRAGFDTVDLGADEVTGYTLVGDNRGRDEDPADEVGHGTGCAGILVASGESLPPGAGGVCALVPVRVLGAALGGGGRRIGIGAIANIDQGMKRLIDLGVKVINMSFGTPASALGPDDPLPHAEIVRYALDRGCILVAASGNSGATECYYPAAHPGVIAVGAVTQAGLPARFSTRGSHVALCAPGQSIRTCDLHGLTSASGTSFAAPFVAGVAALLAARAERRAYPLMPEQARAILMASARPFADPHQEGCGAGILDALAALEQLDAAIDAGLEENA
ncbi:S8 family serine peptidase [uncultured Thiodictyon sp.]|uniref:S8 family peptidase n=1 Tax=uncultured Thiodictyon sp. TaxID=1846217 RepID=UPI0025F30C56|nr:S8 family serine peptidase [uncultured Thiodictyon sp.]